MSRTRRSVALTFADRYGTWIRTYKVLRVWEAGYFLWDKGGTVWLGIFMLILPTWWDCPFPSSPDMI